MENETLDGKLNSAIREFKNIKMSAVEKEQMLKKIFVSAPQAKKSVKSPYTILSFFYELEKSKWFYNTLIPCLVFIMAGGLVFASDNTVPGNALYSFKVAVVEPLHGAFIFSPESYAKYQSTLATRRLVEAERLTNENAFDASKESTLNALLQKHTNTFNTYIETIHKKGKAEDRTSDEIISNFQATMNAHAQVLDILTSNSQVSKTARDDGEKALNILKTREMKDNKDEYAKKKNLAQSIIDAADSDLGMVSAETAQAKQKFINNSHANLEQAKKFLQEADDEDKKGNFKNAYSKLLDSESSARAAGILLDTGLKLKSKNK